MWRPEFSVGVAPIDDQHRRLFHMFGLLMDAVHEQQTESVLDDLFFQLKGYVTSHFRFEERLMRKAGYPILDDHEVLHDKIRENLCEFRSRFQKARDEESRNAVIDEVVLFLVNWLTRHILEEDRQYASYMDNPEVQRLAAQYSHDQ
ncbi:MAG: hemerythrin family protein [Magnetococcales bacterium]|nr:hemerythrin family protein [Magnetococcales bacterium]